MSKLSEPLCQISIRVVVKFVSVKFGNGFPNVVFGGISDTPLCENSPNTSHFILSNRCCSHILAQGTDITRHPPRTKGLGGVVE